MKPRILVVGYAREGFGFGRVLRSILPYLSRYFELHQFELTAHEGEALPWQVYRNQIPGDAYGEQQLGPLVERLQPHLIFILAELWEIQHYVRFLGSTCARGRIVAYCPLDGALKMHQFLEPLSELSRLVVYTEFARHEVLRGFAHLARAGRAVIPPPIEIIPHGVETSLFFPYAPEDQRAGRQRARSELFPGRPELSEAFIVFNGNRNQHRKRIDLTIEGFSLFAADKPRDVLLYLHTGVIDRGSNTLGIARRYGVVDRLIGNTCSRQHPVVTNPELNRIYNACNVGLNTSGGEGWGLVSFEHAASGAAQVVPRHTACAELWNGSALMVGSTALEAQGFPLEMRQVSAEDVAQALQRLYEDQPLREAMALGAFKNATRPEYQWKHVADRFRTVFSQVIDAAAGTVAGRRIAPCSHARSLSLHKQAS